MDKYLKPVPKSAQQANGWTCAHFPNAALVIDTKFQTTYRPTGRFNECKQYFSVKHGDYGLKREVGVAPLSGLAMFVTSHEPAAIADINISYKNLKAYVKFTTKSAEELLVAASSTTPSNLWTVLADKDMLDMMQDFK